MNHEAAMFRIDDLMQGRLQGSDRMEVLAHVAGCKECRSLTETYALLFQALSEGADARAGDHPSSAVLVDFALREERLEPAERDAVATHVMECSSCASHIDAVADAEAELDSTERPAEPAPQPAASRAGFGWVAALAASVTVALLAYPSYLGLFEVPRIKDRLASLESRPSADRVADRGGPVTPLLLHEPARSATASPTIVVSPAQRWVTLAVDPGSLEEYAGAESVRFDLRTTEGVETWSWTMSEYELRERARTGLLFLVPVDALTAERMVLTVGRGPAPVDRVFEAPFEVVRTD